MSYKTELTGTVRSITYPGAFQSPRVRVRLQAESETITLIFLSRSNLECIDIGSNISVTGALTTHRGVPTMFNPSYVLKGSNE